MQVRIVRDGNLDVRDHGTWQSGNVLSHPGERTDAYWLTGKTSDKTETLKGGG